MYSIVYSGDLGEFNHICPEKANHDKYVSRILVEASPLLQRNYIRYVVSERLAEGLGERHFGPNGLQITWPHLNALFRMNEALEFLNENATSLPTLLANDYLSSAGNVIDYPQLQEDMSIDWENPPVNAEPPNQRITPAKLFLMLKVMDGPNGVGYYPETITATFQGNQKFAYNLSWDFFYELLRQPKTRLIYGVDYVYDEDNQVLESMAAYNAAQARLEAPVPTTEPDVPETAEESPEALEEVVEEEAPVPETEEAVVDETPEESEDDSPEDQSVDPKDTP